MVNKKARRIPTAMGAKKNVFIVTESYGSCLITSIPRSVSGVWVPFGFVAWRENGKVQYHRFPELDSLFFSTETEAIAAGFSTGPVLGRLTLKTLRLL